MRSSFALEILHLVGHRALLIGDRLLQLLLRRAYPACACPSFCTSD